MRKSTAKGLFRRMIDRARDLRKQPTRAESVLWDALRNRRLDGVKFRRQYSIGYYIEDFCSPELKLIVEVDGTSHNDRAEFDTQRSDFFRDLGFNTLRFSNDQVVNHIETVLNHIRENAFPSPIYGRGARGEGTKENYA